MTFSPDPARVLAGGRDASSPDLLSVGERMRALRAPEVDAVVVVDFTREVAALSHERFVREALGRLMDVRALVVGEDFCLGAGGAGTVGALAELGRAEGFDVVGVPLLCAGGLPVTATRIRGLLLRGAVEEAASLLGRLHHVRGTVVRGRGEGTGFGFPTANVAVGEGLCLPAEGVYAGWACVDGPQGPVAWPAAINVGKPRTFEPSEQGAAFLEATLLGYSGDLYGSEVAVVFARWLRAPRRFATLDELERTVLANVGWVRATLGERGLILAGERP